MGLPATDFDIVGSYNNQRISEIDSERSVNCFEYRDPLAKKPKSLRGTSGLNNSGFVFTSATGGFRGEFVFLGQQYLVIGAYAFLIEANGTVVKLSSSIDTTQTYVGIDGNEFQVIFVTGGAGYVYDTVSTAFVTITDPSFPARPIDVTMLDEFGVVANGGTINFQLSMFNQLLVWGPDNAGTLSTFTMAGTSSHIVITYATGGSIANYQVGTPVVFSGGSLPAELVAGVTYYVAAIISSTTITVSATDGGTPITSVSGGSGSLTNNGQLQLGSITTHSGTIVACRTLHRRLFLFSQFYTEVWENAGAGTNLPFRRNNAALMEYGTPAIGSISVSFDKMIFLSQSRDGIGPFMLVEGAQAIPISTRALNSQLAIYSALNQTSDCRAYMIQENGIIFYQANFTAANHTFVYDVSYSNPTSENDSDKMWHEKETLAGNRHPGQTHAYFNGINYVGDYQKPILYQVSGTYYSNNGENIPRTRITRPVMNEGSCRRRVDRLFIDMLQGNTALSPIPMVNTFAATSGSSPNLVLSSGTTGSYPVGSTIEFSIGASGVLPVSSPALVAGQIYYIKSVISSTTFTISATSSGSAIDFTTTGTAIIYIKNILNPLSTPYVYLSISKDGGQSYGPILQLPFGAIGQRTFRTISRKLGVTPRGQAFVCKVQFYAQVPFEILGASWVTKVLPE